MKICRTRRHLSSALAVGILAAVMAVLMAPSGSAAGAPTTSPRQGTLEVLGGSVSVDQVMPGGSISSWYMQVVVTLRVSGVPEGTFVESRLVLPGSSEAPWRPTPVTSGGIIAVGNATGRPRTLPEAKNEAARLTTATVEVRIAPESPVLSVQVTRWTRYEPLVLHDVKMKKTKTGATFTGRLVTESGKPIKMGTGFVVVTQFTGATTGVLTQPGVSVRPNGSFTVSTTQQPAPGTIGVWGQNYVNRGAWGTILSSTYSKPFAYRP